LSTSNKRYSREFKLEIVRRIQATGQSQAEVARELDVAPNTISRWMSQYREQKAEAFPGKGSQTSPGRADQPTASRERAPVPRARFSKKTAAYFAATNESDTERSRRTWGSIR